MATTDSALDQLRSAAPQTEQAGETLLDLFADTADRYPHHVAIDASDGVLTYSQLQAAAEELAEELRKCGIGPGDRVGIRLSSGESRLYVGILGVLRSGAAYVPIDAEDPPARAAAILDDAGVCAVLEGDLNLTPLRSPAGNGGEASAQEDAWVIFTSGSTGRPKGVAVTHRSAAAFVQAEKRLWTVLAEDRVLAGLSVAFSHYVDININCVMRTPGLC